MSLSERRWRRLARSVAEETFLTWLAGQAVADLMTNKPNSLSMEELSVAVRDGPVTDLQCRAERFIQKYYYNYPFTKPEFVAAQIEFRKLMQQDLLRWDCHPLR